MTRRQSILFATIHAIRAHLKRTGKTPKQFARECGIAYSTMMYILRGKYDRPATAITHARAMWMEDK